MCKIYQIDASMYMCSPKLDKLVLVLYLQVATLHSISGFVHYRVSTATPYE